MATRTTPKHRFSRGDYGKETGLESVVAVGLLEPHAHLKLTVYAHKFEVAQSQ